MLPPPIPEHERKAAEEKPSIASYVHKPTPLHRSATACAASGRRRAGRTECEAVSVACDKCRPSAVPVELSARRHQRQRAPPTSSSPDPGGLLRSLVLSLTRRSPTPAAEDKWRMVAEELSRKLVHTAEKRDEALHEASRLRISLAELETKILRLESQCRDLQAAAFLPSDPRAPPFPADVFRRAVSDGRAAVRHLARSLIAHLRASDGVPSLIKPYDRNPLFHMEALLNRIFHAGFEEEDAEELAGPIEPAARCEASRAGYEAVNRLRWDDVLLRGTRHYSEGLSRFCDRKMSEVVAAEGWARPWPEPLLQAFFGAAKWSWVVRLMARSVHPAVPLLRAEQGMPFDGRFMEDAAADRVRRVTPATVRTMVAPGFHLYNDGDGGVVKCKVLCVYENSSSCGDSDHSNGTD
ncbi:IRK-interacting protein-like [Curcuma longa]|uniref:IRK-interacting protein-like n=1 Tax=Curcuma longa TaxID=136217 RepID=UPI003D9E2548